MKFKKGDKVRVVNSGKVYRAYIDMAEKLKATKWKFGFGAVGGEVGVIKGRNRDQRIYLVDLGKKEILIGEDGLRGVEDMKLIKWGVRYECDGNKIKLFKSKQKAKDFIGELSNESDIGEAYLFEVGKKYLVRKIRLFDLVEVKK